MTVDVSGYRLPALTKNVLTPDQRLQLLQKLGDLTAYCPAQVDVPYWWAMRKDQWWTAHESVKLAALACEKLGLETTEIEMAVRFQRDTLVRLEKLILLARNEAVAAERIQFLAHRGDGPAAIHEAIVSAARHDMEWAIYTAIRCLAVMCTRTVLNPVDVHEAVRQVRDRYGRAGDGERRIWTPS
jgi:hypothetical protein